MNNIVIGQVCALVAVRLIASVAAVTMHCYCNTADLLLMQQRQRI